MFLFLLYITCFHRVNSARGINRGLEEPFTLAGGASESDGVFVIDDTLVGESDKSSKYTVPIYSD